VRLTPHPFRYDPRVSEPKAVAEAVEEVIPGVWHWAVADERIGGYVSSAHAVRAEGGVVLIDPLPLALDALVGLGDVTAICLTTSSHQRSAWRLRRELGVRVSVPAASREVEEEPDDRYSEGDELPAGLQPIFTPGAGTTQHSLLLARERGVLFTPDLFVHPAGSELALIPDEYAHDPEQARQTAEKLLDLDFALLCTGHGVPVTDDPKSAMRAALAG
jgi:glyoxylase-like metal-dependent hydrolase (beta-lactamase superfamily II)